MRKIRIAQIGTSETEHASQVFGSLLGHPEVFDVLGYADVDHHDKPLHSVFSRSRQLTADEILNQPDLDAVVIECDEKLQVHYAYLAAQRGLPVHLEKPCGDSDADFDRLMDLVQEKGLLLHTGYMYRYNPAVLYALKAVRDGKLGQIYSVEAQMNCFHPPMRRQWLSNFTGGMMFYLGCHLVDLICLFQGVPEAITPLNTATGEDGVTGEDFGMALMHYPHGVSLAKVCALEPGGYLRRQLVICGSKGTIELKPLERSFGGEMVSTEMVENYLDENGKSPWGKEGKHTSFTPYNRYDDMMLSFAAMVRGEKENPYTYDYERQLHKMVLAACGQNVQWK